MAEFVGVAVVSDGVSSVGDMDLVSVFCWVTNL